MNVGSERRLKLQSRKLIHRYANEAEGGELASLLNASLSNLINNFSETFMLELEFTYFQVVLVNLNSSVPLQISQKRVTEDSFCTATDPLTKNTGTDLKRPESSLTRLFIGCHLLGSPSLESLSLQRSRGSDRLIIDITFT